MADSPNMGLANNNPIEIIAALESALKEVLRCQISTIRHRATITTSACKTRILLMATITTETRTFYAPYWLFLKN
jgi:hypothetical protein